jgi:bifunctional DNase/RNase
MSERKMVEMRVSGLMLDENAQSPVVILQEADGERTLPIWIGHAEAGAIAMQLAGKKFERPLTHDLMKMIVDGMKATLEKVAVTELRNNTFLAKMVFERDDEIVSIDARPSDSIALALRTGSPIYVAEDLFKVRSSAKINPKDSGQRLRDFLEGMDPEDFGNVSP